MRQLQKSSAACASGTGRSATARRSRWKACECALTIASTVAVVVMRAPRSPAGARVGGDRRVAEVDVLVGRVADPGRVADEDHARPGGARRARRRRDRRSRRPRGVAAPAARPQGLAHARVEGHAGAVRLRGQLDGDAGAICEGRGLVVEAPRATRPAARGRARGRRSTRARARGSSVSAFGSASSRVAVVTKPGTGAARCVGGDDQPRGGASASRRSSRRRRARVIGDAAQLGEDAHAGGERADDARRPRPRRRRRGSGRCAARGSRAAARATRAPGRGRGVDAVGGHRIGAASCRRRRGGSGRRRRRGARRAPGCRTSAC